MTTSAGRLVCIITQCFRAQELCEKRGELCENEVDVLGFISLCLKVTKSQMYFYWNCEENVLFSGGWLAYKWLQSKIQELRNAEDKEYLERLK